MPRRIDVELTSTRPDGTWTWRAAGARQPKGELDGALLFPGAKVGDVVKADADFDIDGITITAIQPPKGSRSEPERIEIIGAPLRDDQLVTSTLTGKAGRRDDRGPRGGRDGRDGRDGPGGRDTRERRGPRTDRGSRPDGARGPRREAKAGEGGTERAPRRERPARPPRPAPEPRPKAKKLRPGRTHRNEVLASLPEEQKPVAETVLRGGIPAVRQAIETQNAEARAAGTPELNADAMIAIAEQLLPRLRTADWHDKADAALADVDEIDLKDLRSVVVAADAAARDDTTRELAQNLREALSRRVEHEHAEWLKELTQTLADGRTVRALRLSSRPPKAGAPLPAELATRLTEATNAALTTETGAERYATVLDALAYSPVRQAVVPEGVPAEPGEALLTAVRKLAGRVPQIAALFGIEPTPAKSGRSRGPRSGGKVPAPPKRPAGAPAPIPPPPPVAPTTVPEAAVPEPRPADPVAEPPPAEVMAEAPAGETPAAEVVAEPVVEAPVPEAPVAEAPIAEAPVVEAPAADVPAAEAPVPEPVAEAPAAEAPAADVPAAEAPVPEPVAEAPAAEAPAADRPVVEEPREPSTSIESPVSEDPESNPDSNGHSS